MKPIESRHAEHDPRSYIARSSDRFWDWVKRIGVLAGTMIGVATVMGFVWNKATEPLVVALREERVARAAADSAQTAMSARLLSEIRDLRTIVVATGRPRGH